MRAGPAAALDVALVLVFVLARRRTHDDPLALTGLATTAWPFLAGLALGWVVTLLLLRRRPATVSAGVVVWAATVAGGMLLRAASDQGTPPSFVVVATVVLGVFLVGWRVVARQLRRDASTSSSAA